MSADLDTARRTVLAAEKVAEVLARAGIGTVLIGAAALAVHQYPRSTEDLDLAMGVDPRQLEAIAMELRREGFTVEVSEPDADDPLGGVLRVTAKDIDRIELVNFYNPPASGFPALVEASLGAAAPYREGSPLRVVTLPHLVLFKLYAGGLKSRDDVLELLSRNPGLDLDQLREECRRFRLDRKLEAWLRELRQSAEE